MTIGAIAFVYFRPSDPVDRPLIETAVVRADVLDEHCGPVNLCCAPLHRPTPTMMTMQGGSRSFVWEVRARFQYAWSINRNPTFIPTYMYT